MPHVPFRRKLDVREQIERARPRAVILDTQVPNLVVLAERDEVSTFGANVGVLRFDDRVAGAVATGRAVHFERFADGLPRARPVIAGISIAQVEIAPGLVHGDGVESQTREASLCGGLEEAVAAGIVRNDRAVLGRAEVVAPRAWRIGARHDVFASFVVEETVASHGNAATIHDVDQNSLHSFRNQPLTNGILAGRPSNSKAMAP